MWDGGPVDLVVQDCVWRLTEVRLCGVATLTGVSNETCLKSETLPRALDGLEGL